MLERAGRAGATKVKVLEPEEKDSHTGAVAAKRADRHSKNEEKPTRGIDGTLEQ